MRNFKENNNLLFIPGWLDGGKRHGYEYYLDIWNKPIDINRDFQADYVIAHSVGALIALHNWDINKNFKIILVNPVILKGSLFKRWSCFITYEGIPNSFKKSIRSSSVIPALIKMIRLLKVPALDIINRIPKENLLIVYGENDMHLGERKIIEDLNKKGFKIIEVKGAGHNYDERFEEVISNNI